MPNIDLDDMELIEAARGARCLAELARKDAASQGGSSSRHIFEKAVKYHEAMAAKFDEARKSGDSRQKDTARNAPGRRTLGR